MLQCSLTKWNIHNGIFQHVVGIYIYIYTHIKSLGSPEINMCLCLFVCAAGRSMFSVQGEHKFVHTYHGLGMNVYIHATLNQLH